MWRVNIEREIGKISNSKSSHKFTMQKVFDGTKSTNFHQVLPSNCSPCINILVQFQFMNSVYLIFILLFFHTIFFILSTDCGKGAGKVMIKDILLLYILNIEVLVFKCSSRYVTFATLLIRQLRKSRSSILDLKFINEKSILNTRST